ncbi:DUF1127 domain-containing protein [Acetobacteraceae bacterium H6797]|nr:DUF1127 domain-containing protein [Acetobacteraceae bacterium H6797]
MSDLSLRSHSPDASSELLPRLARLLRRWWRNATTRQSLDELPDHILRDIGTDWRDARLEARKPFWED